MNNLHNLEAGLTKALVTTFRAKGHSEQQANAKASQHLDAARMRFHAGRAEAQQKTSRQESQLATRDIHRIKLAMRDVIAWARTL